MKITKKKLASMIDHTYLKPFASEEDMDKLIFEAKSVNCAMIAINSVQTAYCKKHVSNSQIHVGAAISFPLGQTTIESKIFETKNAIENGADEIDYVVNLTQVKENNWSYIEDEMKQIVNECHSHKVICKVIFENCYLNNEQKIKLCEIAKKVQPDFIKTSTGFGTSGATIEDVKLMKQYVGDKVKVKAAGGIRDLTTALSMIEAGAERIGTSATLKILQEFDNENTIL